MGDVQVDPSNGIDEGYNGHNQVILQSMTAFTAIAWYNAIELITLILYIFKSYKGTYFWSLLVTSFIIIPYQFGAWAKQVEFQHLPHLLPVGFSNISWMILIPGQSLVLWSRLHLVAENQTLLRFIFWLIVVDFILFCIPTSVLTWGSNIDSSSHNAFLRGYNVVEKVQMTMFSAQEVFISSVYLWEIRKTFHVVYEGSSRRIMLELAAINVVIIALDIAMVAVEYLDLFEIETTMKGMVYSIKLKMEFVVLSKLVKVATKKGDSRRTTAPDNTMDLTRMLSSVESGKQMDVEKGEGHESLKGAHKGTTNDNLPPEWRPDASDNIIHDSSVQWQTREQHRRKSQQSTSSDLSYPGRLA